MPIVDAHIHLFPPEVVNQRERFLALDRHFADLYTNPKCRLATAEDALASLDRNGIDFAFALGFGWSDPTLCRMHNDYLIEVQRQYPERFASFAALQPCDSQAALTEINRVAAAGLKGIGELMPHGQGYALDDWTVMDPVAEAATALGLAISIHVSEPVGHGYPGKGAVTPATAYRLAERHPSLRLIFAHWGGGLPFYELMPEVAIALRNVWYDSAATTYLYHFEIFKIVAELVSADRILFGTDYPLLRQGPFLQKVRALGLPESTLEQILGGNAVRFINADGTWQAHLGFSSE
ncbi:MAG TPA: amidohydrolase family protein [Chloroflexota bacterium]|nr:amidohydrolase family protein [Chloroflexota bacterium]